MHVDYDVMDRARQTGHNPGKDYQADPVADSSLGDLLSHPHDERGPCRQGNHHHETKVPTWRFHDLRPRASGLLEGDGSHESLEHRQHHGQVARILGYLPAAQLPFF